MLGKLKMNNQKKMLQSIVLLFFTFLLSACGDTSPFTVSPGSLTFSTQIGGIAPSSKTFTIKANQNDTAVPDISVTGDAIDLTNSYPTSCYGNSTVLDCRSDYERTLTVTVPVPDPDDLGVGTHTASILIQSSQHSVTLPVTYTVSAGTPAVSQVSPYVAVAGNTHTVTIRGGGFANFGTSIPIVTFGGTAGTNATLVNNSTITVDLPVLAAGAHAITVAGASVDFPSTTNLVVVADPGYTADSIPQTSPAYKIIYDDERKAIYTVNRLTTPQQIEKYTFNGSAWSSTPDATYALDGNGDAALSTDGATLLVVTNNDDKVYEVDPTTMTQIGTGTSVTTSFSDCTNDTCLDSVAITSDGFAAVLDSGQWQDFYIYDPSNSSVVSGYSYTSGNSKNFYYGVLQGSRSGNRIHVHTQASSNDIINIINKTVTGVSDGYARRALSGDGKVIATGSSVRKDSGSGYVSYAYLPYPDATALSLDGNTAYVLSLGVLKVFDISTATVAQIGSDISLPTVTGGAEIMTISIDGKTAFIAGATNIVVVPIP